MLGNLRGGMRKMGIVIGRFMNYLNMNIDVRVEWKRWKAMFGGRS
jgi:hypothetical protein